MDRETADFLHNLRRRIEASGRSESDISRQIGRARGYVSDLLRRRKIPNVLTARRLADALECRLEDLLEPGPAQSLPRGQASVLDELAARWRERASFDGPEINDVLGWAMRSDGRLVGDREIRDFTERFGAPDIARGRPTPIFLGRTSLAAREFGLRRAEELGHVFALAEPRLRASILAAQAKVLAEGKSDLARLSLELQVRPGLCVHLDYVRLLVRVEEADGRFSVLNYARPLRRAELFTARRTASDAPEEVPRIRART